MSNQLETIIIEKYVRTRPEMSVDVLKACMYTALSKTSLMQHCHLGLYTTEQILKVLLKNGYLKQCAVLPKGKKLMKTLNAAECKRIAYRTTELGKNSIVKYTALANELKTLTETLE